MQPLYFHITVNCVIHVFIRFFRIGVACFGARWFSVKALQEQSESKEATENEHKVRVLSCRRRKRCY